MPVHLRNFDELVRMIAGVRSGVVCIDGYQGAGKTTLGARMASTLGMPIVHLDDFLERGRGKFLEALRYRELAGAIRNGPVILEGVCLLAVTDRLRVRPRMFLYLLSPRPNSNTPRGSGLLAAEVTWYHATYKPHKYADVVYTSPEVYEATHQMLSDRTQIDVAYIKAKTTISIALGAGGMLTLLIGLMVLLFGLSSDNETLIKITGLEVSAKGLGGVIMATSMVWAYFAYQARPKYSHSREASEKYNAESGLMERFERESSTAVGVRQRE